MDRRHTTIIKLIIILLCGGMTFVFVYNDFGLYDKPAGKVIYVKNHNEKQIVGIDIKNGNNKGQTVEIESSYDSSLVYDQKYHTGDVVFLDNGQSLITGIKRDHWIAAAVIIMLGMLLVFGGKQGLLTITCVAVDVAIFTVMTMLYIKGVDILVISVVSCIFFDFMIIVLVKGISRAAFVSFLATVAALVFVGSICMFLIWTATDIGYEYLEFLPEPYTVAEADRMFLSQIMISSLGAIIDVAVTITACSAELIRKTPDISVKSLVCSAKEVADDISGTMINVVFFTNMAAVIPVFIISMRNDIGFFTVLKYDAFFEITRFLSGAIGILAAIPLAIIASSLFMRKGDRK